jgi:hypothetical protein
VALRATEQEHRYAECPDDFCPRFPCRVYKEAYRDGYEDGYSAGSAAGYAAGYADGCSEGDSAAAAA